MKRLAALCLSGCLTTGILGCSGPSALASPPSSAASVTVRLNSGSPCPYGVSASASAPYGKNKVAVVTAYYHAVAAQHYRLASAYLAPNATRPDGQRLTWAASCGSHTSLTVWAGR